MDVIADRFAATIIEAVRREYPNAPRHVMRDADDRPTPREVHPAFYGCFDWHSAVEMHWALAALIRLVPDGPFVSAARRVLAEHLTEANLRAEAGYFATNPGYERPYGWGWTLQLAEELGQWAESGDALAAEFARNFRPLADVIEAGFIAWLPKPAYPDRTGMHSNSAFALTRALPYARRRAQAGQPGLHEAISTAAVRWFGGDEEYSAAFEPSGADFLSPALTEIVLMRELLADEAFEDWYWQFAGGGVPIDVCYPARVTDAEDGQGAHLHGLNLYRLHAFRYLAERTDDPTEEEVLTRALERHVEAAAAALSSEGWMSEHWLAAYGVLAYREDDPPCPNA